jgi:hypothetical protein
MKYIKLFESFKDFSNIKNDIRDIFVELNDEKFNIRFRPHIGWKVREDNPDRIYDENFLKAVNKGDFSVILEKNIHNDYDFQIGEVYEYIMMLIEFIETIGINSKVRFKVSTRNKRGSNYTKKMTLSQLEKFIEEAKPVNFLEIIFESNINESYDDKFTIDDKFKKDVQDMFVELKDEDYNIFWYYKSPSVKAFPLDLNYDNYSEIRIYKFLGFDLEQIKEYILMFNEYMEEKFNNVNFSYKIENIYQEETDLPSYKDLQDVKEEIVSLSILIERE